MRLLRCADCTVQYSERAPEVSQLPAMYSKEYFHGSPAGYPAYEADEALRAQIAQWADTGAFYVAQSYAYRGDDDRALEWLQRAYKQRDAALADIVGLHLFGSMADDPRFKAFLRHMKLPEWPTQAIAATGK